MNMITELINSHENSVLIAFGVFLLLMTLYGHYRGFIRMAVSMASAVISFLLVKWMLPAVTAAVGSTPFFREQTRKLSEGLFLSGEEADYSALYRQLGLDRVAEATGEYLAGIIINVVCFIILFVLINLLLKVAAHFLNALTALPILHGTNQILGAAIGFAEGVFYLWILMIALAFMPAAGFSEAVLSQIIANEFLLWLYQNNLLLNILAGILGIG